MGLNFEDEVRVGWLMSNFITNFTGDKAMVTSSFCEQRMHGYQARLVAAQWPEDILVDMDEYDADNPEGDSDA